MPVHGAVEDAIATALALLGICESVDELDILDEITADAADELEKVVLVVLLAVPEGDVLEAGRILAVRLKLDDPARLELIVEAWIGRPKEPNVGNLKEKHREALEAQPKGPPDRLLVLP